MKNNLQPKFSHHVRGDGVDTTLTINYDLAIFVTCFSESLKYCGSMLAITLFGLS